MHMYEKKGIERMNFFENLNLQKKKQILTCLMLSTSLVYANNNSINDSNYKSNTGKISNSNEKTDRTVDKKKDVSSSRYHDIMATKGDCSASCCSNKSATTEVENSNNQKSKKKFGWFFRSK